MFKVARKNNNLGQNLINSNCLYEDYICAQFRMDIKQCCVKLSVQPSRGLVDEKFIVLIQSAPPGFQLTIHALHQCEDGHNWQAFAHYTANATGIVNGTWFNA